MVEMELAAMVEENRSTVRRMVFKKRNRKPPEAVRPDNPARQFRKRGEPGLIKVKTRPRPGIHIGHNPNF
jgi:hypothetical protein